MGLIITAEIRVELAELFMDLAGVDSKFIQEQQNGKDAQSVLTIERKTNLHQAYENAVQSV